MIQDSATQSCAAVQRGLDFLDRAIKDDGAWSSRFYRNLSLTGAWVHEQPPFIAALSILSLNIAEPRCAALRARSRDFLLRRAEPPGVWRYLDKLPPDADDTALCSLATGGDPRRLLSPRQIELLLACRNADGLFRTWIVPAELYQSDLPGVHDVDSVVNANVLAWLGARDETDAARRWIEDLIREQREADTSYHYPEPLDLHVAVARAACVRAPLFASLLPALTQRLRAYLAAPNDDPARTAQALSALDQLGADLTEPPLHAAISRLLRAQCADGNWRQSLLWRGPVPPAPPSLGYASSALSTAFCIEALHRFAQRAGHRAAPPAIATGASEAAEEGRETFADLLQPIQSLFPPPLLADAHWRRVLALAQRLPHAAAERTFGFEFRLADARAAADLCVSVEPNSQLAWHLIACGATAADAARGSPQALLGAMLRAQCEQRDSFYAAAVAGILLEYDLAETAPLEEPPFGIFLLPHARNSARIEWRNDPDEARALHRALAALAGWDADADEQRALLQSLDALAHSDDGHLYHAGVMPGRTPRAIRLVLKGMTAAEIADYLARMQWRGAMDAVETTLLMNDAFSEVALSVDIDARGMAPRIGLELYQPLPWDACNRAVWHPLLGLLRQRGLCIAPKADALRRWPGAHMRFGSDRAYRARIGINHIKITLDAQRIEAKAYVGMSVREER